MFVYMFQADLNIHIDFGKKYIFRLNVFTTSN